jgi:hypothetical protein
MALELIPSLFPNARGYIRLTPEILYDAAMRIMLSSLDGDRNTLMHYICYFEASDILSLIVAHAGDRYHELMLQKNRRGQLPGSFCRYANDPAFQERIDGYTRAAERKIEETSLWYRSKSLMKSCNFWQISQTICALAFGRMMFNHGILISTAVTCVAYAFSLSAKQDYAMEHALMVDHVVVRIIWHLLVFLWGACHWAVGGTLAAALYGFGWAESAGGYALYSAMVSGLWFADVLMRSLEWTGAASCISRCAGSNIPMRNIMRLLVYALIGWSFRACLRLALPSGLLGSMTDTAVAHVASAWPRTVLVPGAK